jgi:L,D-transpeptidase YcbB
MQMSSRFTGALAVAIVGISLACGESKRTQKETAPPPDPAVQAAATAKSRPQFAAPGKQGNQIWKEEQRFYEANGYQLVWSDGKRPRAAMDALIRAINAAPEEGLDPADYDRDALAAARQQFDPAQAAAIDVRSTYALLKYAWHLSRGTIDPAEVNPQWKSARKPADLVTALSTALRDGDVEQWLKSLTPKAPPYHGLRAHLARYRAMAERGGGDAAAGLSGLPSGESPKGKKPAPAPTVNDVIRLIAVNMDRWRWMPDDLGSRYLIVNIPAFRLDVVENGTSVLDMKVVTGRKEDPTPVFSDQMTHIVFSPYWNIPKTIVDNEIMPKLDADPAYLERNNIEMVPTSGNVDDLRLRQRPGAGNSLGLVKFMFPNNFNVYLHDTPADSLFNRIERDFSHGCVRVEKPVELARYVLRDQPEWTQPRIAEAMHAGDERTVKLTEPLSVYLAYLTAWDDRGTLQIRPDVYGHDRTQLAVSEVERRAE